MYTNCCRTCSCDTVGKLVEVGVGGAFDVSEKERLNLTSPYLLQLSIYLSYRIFTNLSSVLLINYAPWKPFVVSVSVYWIMKMGQSDTIVFVNCRASITVDWQENPIA